MFAVVASSTILAVLITGTLLFSVIFVLRYRSRREKDMLSLIVVSVGLTLCFSTLALVPVDVWLASMENSSFLATQPGDSSTWRKNVKWITRRRLELDEALLLIPWNYIRFLLLVIRVRGFFPGRETIMKLIFHGCEIIK